ncbi:hypothetical protein IW261DRAFT_1575417 [Armillaria novae-zelandiae]|uniref:Uncharacterized protein n=1 Tax=Armillaria novae-zelandiae TaxID=153914 RepID=A0AA39NE99_9AGAR|nr:hypothetical protein IW261DRAFT_1575417 [Armillaria novae-zelandiae]
MSTDTTNPTVTPTSTTIETPASTTEISKPTFIIAFKGVKRVFLQWPDVADYDALFVALNQQFPEISLEFKDSYAIQTDDLDICGGIYVDIPRELWGNIGAQITRIRIMYKGELFIVSGLHRLEFYQIRMNMKYWAGSRKASPAKMRFLMLFMPTR